MNPHPDTKKVVAVGASASIVIPLRLQVTGPSLGAIEALEKSLTDKLMEGLIRTRTGECKIHSVSVDKELT